MSDMAGWLATVGEQELALLLAERPDVLGDPEPRNVAELADRLSTPYSVVDLLRAAPRPVLQVCEALLVLGEPRRRPDLVGLLDNGDGVTPSEHTDRVDTVLAWLTDRAVVWPGVADELHLASGLPGLFGQPLGLGPPARHLLADVTVGRLNTMLSRLGCAQQKSKAATLAAVVAALSDAERVRRLVGLAPAEVAAELARLARGEPETDTVRYDQGRARARLAAGRWAADYGLLVGGEWSYNWEMPAEVGHALRGPGYRAPFDPVPPTLGSYDVTPQAVANESAVAAVGLADRAVSVLDQLARKPAVALKTGGIGVRELTRLAKVTGSAETGVRLVLELADALGLLAPTGTTVGVSDQFDPWRRREPASRFVELLTTWWELSATPTEGRDEAGKAQPAVRRQPGCDGCRAARRALLTEAAALPSGTAVPRERLAARMRWSRPLVHLLAQDGDDDFATHRREATLLGLLVLDSASALGRALVAADDAEMARIAAAMLPDATDTAVFGSDSTALVAGVPSARVGATLDLAADRESHGAAVLWRFSATSVRGALDEGVDRDELLARLEQIATSELPQPLRYLIADVARRHGSVRVREAVTVLHGNDAALLAQVSADRALRKLGLSLLAPTVILGQADVDTTLSALRKAGYLPVREDDHGTLLVEGAAATPEEHTSRRTSPSRVRALPAVPEPVDPRQAAARILAGDRAATGPTSRTEVLLNQLNGRLSAGQVRLLAHAIDHGGPVVIEYDAASGGRTLRTISDMQLLGGSLEAWCHLRQDDRMFSVSRIQAAHPSGTVPA